MSEKIKFVYLNLVDQDATTITASTEDAFYPASNLKDPRTTKKWRSTTASDSVVFDFVTTEEVDTIIVRGDALNGRGFNSTLTIEANATDTWGSPAYTNTITFDDNYNIGSLVLAASESYRFWRIVGTGTSYVELSNICLGKSFIPGRNMTNSFKYEERDLSSRTSNKYGQSFFIERNRQDTMSIDFKYLTSAQLDEFSTMFSAIGETKPVWIIPDNAAFFSSDRDKFSSQFYLTKVPTYSHAIKGLYNISMKFIEVI